MPAPLTQEPGRQFLDFIHQRMDALRAHDRVPDSLDAWRAQRQELRNRLLQSWGGFPETPCPLEPRVLGRLERDGYQVEKVVFQTRPGVFMTANAYVPQAPGRRPAVLCVHGHWRGAKQDPVPQARCIGLAKLGFFVLAVDAFGAGERGLGKALGEYHGEMVATTLWPVGLPLSGLQVYENMRAVDYLLTRPEVDGAKIGITGASGGGNQSMYAGAFDERIACVAPVCSVGTYRSYLGAACCVCEVVPGAMTYTEEWAILALVAPRALMVVNATRDAFQFSVGEAQKSVAQARRVFALYGKEHHLAHAVFESGHDYNQPMREAVYGFMALHLAGRGEGQPAAEPALAPEDPETLRCYPAETRPDDFITIPKFASAQAALLIESHSRNRATHKEQWQNNAMRLKHELANDILGGFPKPPEVLLVSRQQADESVDYVIAPEPGIEIAVQRLGNPGRAGKLAVLLDLEGAQRARGTPTCAELLAANWQVVLVDLRATGRYAVPGNKIGKAPDHNAAEWAVWTGRPLLGQWAWDARCVIDLLATEAAEGIEQGVLIGLGPASLIALVCAIFDPRVTRVATTGGLASFRTETPYENQYMGLFAPGILRYIGDVPHLAALLAPRRLVVAGGVNGAGKPLELGALRDAYEPARQVYKFFDVEGHLTVLPDDNDLAVRLSR